MPRIYGFEFEFESKGDTWTHLSVAIILDKLLLLKTLGPSIIIIIVIIVIIIIYNPFYNAQLGIILMHFKQTNVHSSPIINLMSTISPWSSGPGPLIPIAK